MWKLAAPQRHTNVLSAACCGRFSLSLWKARIKRFKTVSFSSCITGGAIIDNYLIATVAWHGYSGACPIRMTSTTTAATTSISTPRGSTSPFAR